MITYERYAEIRNSKGLKDSDICRMTKIPQSTFSEWKNGKYIPKYEKMVRIAEALEMDYYELVGPVGKFSGLNPANAKLVPMLQEMAAETAKMVPALEGMSVPKFDNIPGLEELKKTIVKLQKAIPSINFKFDAELLELFHNASDETQSNVMLILKNSQKDEGLKSSKEA